MKIQNKILSRFSATHTRANLLSALPTTVFVLLFGIFVSAMPAPTAYALPAPQTELSEAEIAQKRDEIQKRYDEVMAKWIEALKEINTAKAMYFTLPRAEATPWREKYLDALARGNEQQSLFEDLSVERFDLTDRPDEMMLEEVLRVAKFRFDNGRYDACLEVTNKLLEPMDQDDRVKILQLSALSMTNRFDDMLEFLSKYSETIQQNNLIDVMQKDALSNFKMIQTLHMAWEREQQFLEKDKEKGDLPIVEITASTGVITVELFEDEAPLAVNNFIQLVESGYYDGKTFHRVMNHFMAQVGGKKIDGSYEARPYTIADEHALPVARHHFRGSLGMGRTTQANSASTEFFIDFAPKPGLNHFPNGPEGNGYTVFGRVIDGWDALDRLTRTVQMIGKDEEEKEVEINDVVPDRIISAKVIRKRDHEYVVTPFSGQMMPPAHNHDHDH